MKLTKVSYGKTFNIGNYQSERVEMEVEIEETDALCEVFAALKASVHSLARQPLPRERDTPYEMKNFSPDTADDGAFTDGV